MPSRAWDLGIQDILEAIACIQQATAGNCSKRGENKDKVFTGLDPEKLAIMGATDPSF